MGACRICGKQAGFLRSEHPDCVSRRARGRSEIERMTLEAIRGGVDRDELDQLDQRVVRLASETGISSNELYLLRIGVWQKLADEFISDGCIDPALQSALATLAARYKLTTKDQNSKGHVTKIGRASVLLSLGQGKLPVWPLQLNVPINLLKGEQVVWVFGKVELLEDRVHRAYAGGYGGPSVRVLRGVYMRAGAFRGEPIATLDRVHAGSGALVATDRHIYFAGGAKSFRVPFDKVVSFLPFTNGVGIVRDSVNAKAQIFVTGDGFAFDLLTRLAAFVPGVSSATDPLYERAVRIVVETGRSTVPDLQRHLRIGYAQALGLIEEMQRHGVVSAPDEKGTRTVLRAR